MRVLRVITAIVLLVLATKCAGRKKKWKHFNSTHCLDLPTCRNKPVAFVTYHKTGHNVAHTLGFQLSKHLGMSFANKSKLTHHGERKHTKNGCPRSMQRDPQDHHMFQGQRVHVYQVAPDIFCDTWTENFPIDAKIVHFVRDPYDMALSGFLYHTQDPTPENWILRHDPCKHSNTSLELMRIEVGAPASAISKLLALCHSLYDESNLRFYEQLRALPPTKGLKLYTASALINRAGAGDILRMGNNLRRISQWGGPTLAVNMELWKTNTPAAAKAVAEFILDYKHGPSLRNNVTLQAAIARVQRGMSAALQRSKRSKHSTGAIWSKERKSEMKAQLRDDPAFKILRYVRDALADAEKK